MNAKTWSVAKSMSESGCVRFIGISRADYTGSTQWLRVAAEKPMQLPEGLMRSTVAREIENGSRDYTDGS
jgi:hypothetical protein